jgi:ABC-type sugar transport system permease subunit
MTTVEQGRKVKPRRWRPVFSVGSLVSGLVLGLGSSILLQQYSVRVLTRGNLIQTVVASVVVAIVLPSLGQAVGVRRVNARLRKAGVL